MTYPMNENCYEQNQYASNYYHQMIRWKLSFVRPNNGSSNPTIRRFSRGWHSCMKDRGDRVYRYKCAYWRIFMLENKWRIFIFTFNPQLKGMKTSSPFDLETTEAVMVNQVRCTQGKDYGITFNVVRMSLAQIFFEIGNINGACMPRNMQCYVSQFMCSA